MLLSRCGTIVSGDSTGSVQFWDSRHGTLLQAHSYHKGDVNALTTVPSENRVFLAGSDGQVRSITKTAIRLKKHLISPQGNSGDAEIMTNIAIPNYIIQVDLAALGIRSLNISINIPPQQGALNAASTSRCTQITQIADNYQLPPNLQALLTGSQIKTTPITRVHYRKKFKGKERASDEQTVTVMSNLNAPPVFLPLFLNNMYSFPLRSIFTSWMVSASSSLVQQHLFIPWKNTQYTPSACPPRFELLEEENGVINNNKVMTQENNLSSGSSRDLRTTCSTTKNTFFKQLLTRRTTPITKVYYRRKSKGRIREAAQQSVHEDNVFANFRVGYVPVDLQLTINEKRCSKCVTRRRKSNAPVSTLMLRRSLRLKDKLDGHKPESASSSKRPVTINKLKGKKVAAQPDLPNNILLSPLCQENEFLGSLI